MAMYPHDNYPYQLDSIDQEIHRLKEEREKILQSAEAKPLAPHEQRLVELAYQAGEMTAAWRSEREFRERLEKKLTTANQLVEELRPWRQRASDWENKASLAETALARLRKARRKK